MFCPQCGAAVAGEYKFCASCGSPAKAQSVAQAQAQPPHKRSNANKVILIVSLLGLALIGYVLNQNNATSTTSNRAPIANGPQYNDAHAPVAPVTTAASPLPEDERAFISAVESARAAYNAQPNEMAKGGVRAQRRTAVCRVLPEMQVSDWVGHIAELESNSDGKGVLKVSIGDSVSVETWNNAFSDIGSNTLIDPNSSLFGTASRMKKGNEVLFSGTFLPSDVDCVRETSMTLDGSMTSPDYVFRFSAVRATAKRYVPGPFRVAQAMELMFGNFDPSTGSSRWDNIHKHAPQFAENSGEVNPFFDAAYNESGLAKHVILTVADGGHCHACTPLISAFVFVERGGNWFPEIEQYNLRTEGSWGKPPEAKILKIGPDLYGISLSTGYWAQGESTRTTTILVPSSLGFAEAISIPSDADNADACGPELGPCYSGHVAYEFVPGKNSSVYDVITKESGTKMSDNGQLLPATSTSRYSFIGGKYQLQS